MIIYKVKNFEGYLYHCSCCGKEIQHAYTLSIGGAVMGSVCILKSSALKKTTKIAIAIADARRNKFERDGVRLAGILNMSISEIETGILEGSIH